MEWFCATLIRGARFAITFPAKDRSEALKILTDLSKKHDVLDHKETQIVSLKKVKQEHEIHHSSN